MTPDELRAIAVRLNPNLCRDVDQARAVTDAKIALHDAADALLEAEAKIDALYDDIKHPR